jgi:hypothetical protein
MEQMEAVREIKQLAEAHGFGVAVWDKADPPAVAGIEAIVEERARQLTDEGWDAEHDDGHRSGELAMAAACYAVPLPITAQDTTGGVVSVWPFEQKWDKRLPRTRPAGPCPHDTDGDGNCGQRRCPWCGPLTEPARRMAFRALVAPGGDEVSQRVHELAKAGALIAAEIDRLTRTADGPREPDPVRVNHDYACPYGRLESPPTTLDDCTCGRTRRREAGDA